MKKKKIKCKNKLHLFILFSDKYSKNKKVVEDQGRKQAEALQSLNYDLKIKAENKQRLYSF